MNNKKNIQHEEGKVPVMNRKEALKKAGYVALSAATMMILINKPDKAVASSPANFPVW
ncbi:MAG: hypothetical protein RBS73_03160 [Prolixibacteraceae bacterium]|jgi:hypothetical protein|nr:hypothetical protein [Prolixibacteraceae bacterium]